LPANIQRNHTIMTLDYQPLGAWFTLFA